ncbi:MAG: hypothetical protein AB8B53_12080 [Flavobacteriales bacterium]
MGFLDANSARLLLTLLSFIGFSFNSYSQGTLSYETKAHILEQILESNAIYIDSSDKCFYINNRHKDLFQEYFFTNYLKKNQLKLTNNEFECNEALSFSIDFIQNTFTIHHNRVTFKDGVSAISYGFDTKLYFRVDPNTGELIKPPSSDYFTEDEKQVILKQLLEKIDQHLDTTYDFLNFHPLETEFFEKESFVLKFCESNGIKQPNQAPSQSQAIYLNLTWFLDQKSIHIYPSSYYDDLEIGERVFSDHTFNNFYFRVTDNIEVVPISLEEYKKLQINPRNE